MSRCGSGGVCGSVIPSRVLVCDPVRIGRCRSMEGEHYFRLVDELVHAIRCEQLSQLLLQDSVPRLT